MRHINIHHNKQNNMKQIVNIVKKTVSDIVEVLLSKSDTTVTHP